jgi:hypothetical protein
MLWTFVFGFCVILAFIANYILLEESNAIAKECPGPITDPQTGVVLTPAPDPYSCIPAHLYFLETIRYIATYTIPVYVVLMIASFHKILRMIQVMDNMLKSLSINQIYIRINASFAVHSFDCFCFLSCTWYSLYASVYWRYFCRNASHISCFEYMASSIVYFVVDHRYRAIVYQTW